jgi:2-polyprenyl-3-methyl-5-hydroxy-6-metoxy-1,4-benzoquinol methylase
MDKVNSGCIVCGGSERSLLYTRNQWRIYKCANCGLGVLDPRPGKDELDKLYSRDYFQSHYNSPLALSSAQMKKRLRQEDHRLRFIRKFKTAGKILDIGCGRGYFLLACRQAGYKVEGIDISDAAADYVMAELKIRVNIGQIDQITFPAGSFDIVTMWHSLEHAADPDLHLQSAEKWLKKNGLLVVDVPNYEGHDARKAWSDWPHWDLPYHFYHFTKSSLLALLEKNGFVSVGQKDYLSEYVKEKLMNKALPGFIARLIAGFYSGGSFVVAARKKRGSD